jgi:hypothetical protein
MKLKTKDGWTPLAIACIYKCNDVFDVLMKCGG